MKCPECDGTQLSWGQTSQAYSRVPGSGRLRSSEVRTVFFIGCDECSATVKSFEPDEIIELMDRQSRTIVHAREEEQHLRGLLERIDALFWDGEEATYSNPEGAHEAVLGDMVQAFVTMVRRSRHLIRSGADLDAVRRALEPLGTEDDDMYSDFVGQIRSIVFQGGQNGESVRRELIRLFTE